MVVWSEYVGKSLALLPQLEGAQLESHHKLTDI